MPNPITFDSQTPRFGLPLLYAGQAQKEVFVNEAAARTDVLLHCAVEAQTATPPGSPSEGQCWIVGTSATGAWAGKDGRIAAWIGGNWLFFTARDGLRVLNRSSGQDQRFSGSWRAPTRPAAPTGGTIVDAESRAAITAILGALTTAGLIPAT